jgi:hypothetical protein
MSKTMADVGREGLNRSSLNRTQSAILFGGEMPKGIYRHGIRQINCKTCGKVVRTMFNRTQYCKEHSGDKPWERTFRRIKSRCSDEKDPYFQKGRKCFITKDELKFLWYRDRGWLLKKPSIDRIDNDGNYVLSNCRFIEHSENVGKDSRRNRVKQYDLNGKFIKQWNSQREAGKILGICQNGIVRCCQKKRHTCGGFIWKYGEWIKDYTTQKTATVALKKGE